MLQNFKFISVDIPGLIVIEPNVYLDERGFFLESYNKESFIKGGITDEFVQDNHSKSKKGVLRGLHFQKPPKAQAKLLRVIYGAIYDVAVDIRNGSPTYGKWFAIELSDENKKMLYIPVGFAHGFYTLEDNTELLYKCTKTYAPDLEGGIIYNDPDLNIHWPLEGKPIVSKKDKSYQKLRDLGHIF